MVVVVATTAAASVAGVCYSTLSVYHSPHTIHAAYIYVCSDEKLCNKILWSNGFAVATRRCGLVKFSGALSAKVLTILMILFP